jgi:signal transduction histidine kinase
MARPRHTVLVVDDEGDVVKSVQDLLRLDFRVLGTTDAHDALRLMEENEVHIVMSDQRMPEMTGVEFLHRCRGEHPEAIRLLFTGYADIRAVIEAINQGNVYRYLTKPWDPDELQSVMREAAERFDLIVARQRLTEELRQKNAELERANEELRQSMELKTAFIQVASHELRTPLAILLGLTRLATTARADVPEPVAQWHVRMDAAAHRLRRLVDELVAMLSAGRFEHALAPEVVDLPNLLRQAADDVRPFVELRHQTLRQDWPADLGTIEADPAKLRDSLNHLLLNAVKFTPDGGTITLAASRRPAAPDAVEGGDAEAGGVQIRVTDTGVGVDAAALARLFEPFFTGFDPSHHSSGTHEFNRKGLGLGLSVVKAFVELHGGRVTAASEPREGTTVVITLPARPTAPPVETAEARAAAETHAPPA